MKRLLKTSFALLTLAALVSSCGSKETGQLTGVADRPDWKGINPYAAAKRPVLLLNAKGPCEVEIAADAKGDKVVWTSKPETGKVTVTAVLESGPMYTCRVRPAGGAWSPWHQPFAAR